jgi:capsular exopolysaccharide synthesis family protein
VEYRHQLGIVRGWLPFLLLGLLVAAIPTYLLASRQAPEYQVSAVALPERLLPQAGADFNEVSVSRFTDLASTWAFMAKRPEVLNAVAEQLGITDSITDLARRIDATVDAGTASLEIVARGSDDEEATALANAVVDVVALQSSTAAADDPRLVAQVAQVRDRLLEEEQEYAALLEEPLPRTPEQEARLTQRVALLAELRATYTTLVDTLNRPPDGLVVVERATTASAERIAPRAMYFTVLAALAGLFAAAAIAFVVEYLDDRVSTSREVKETTGLATLAAIGRPRRLTRRSPKYSLPTLRDPRSAMAEAFRSLRTNIEVGSSTNPPRSVLVTSASASEGKSITAANLAIAFAQAGTRVVLIDADLRRPSVHSLFKLANNSGLSSLLRDPSVPLDNVAHTIAQEENLRVLTSGPPPLDASAMLGSESMRALLRRLAREADVLVLDSPPLQVAVDATVLASRVDGTLVVIDASKTRKGDIADAVQALSDARAKLIGAVLYRAPRSTHGDYGASGRATRSVSPALDRGDVG